MLRSEYPFVKVLAIAGLQRLAFGQLECSCSIRLPPCPEKKRIRHALLVEAMGKLVEMRDEEDLDALLQQRAGYLPSDLGALPLIRRREGFVEQNHAVRAQPVDDLAHPAELLVE